MIVFIMQLICPTVYSNINNTTMGRQTPHYKPSLLFLSLLQGMLTKRKSYCFQLIKQFYLFPEESSSSNATLDKYDRLIFSDEQLHTLFKKLQTKLIQNKIWAFINLKALPYIQAASKMERPIKKLKKRIDTHHVLTTFQIIKTFAYTQITQITRSPTKVQTSSFTKIKITESRQQVSRVQAKRRNNYLAESGNRRLQGSRSRSGSITRFEYDVENGQRLLLNGEIIPCRISVKRSESPLRQPEYIKITKTAEGSSQDIRYIGVSKNQLQKRQNLNLQYNSQGSKKYIPPREDSRSRIIYVEASQIGSQNRAMCPHCLKPHSNSICQLGSEKKIKRLRSSSKKLSSQGYLEHLA